MLVSFADFLPHYPGSYSVRRSGEIVTASKAFDFPGFKPYWSTQPNKMSVPVLTF